MSALVCVGGGERVAMYVRVNLGHYIHRHEKAGYNDTHPFT